MIFVSQRIFIIISVRKKQISSFTYVTGFVSLIKYLIKKKKTEVSAALYRYSRRVAPSEVKQCYL
jgi:hypothetical protein